MKCSKKELECNHERRRERAYERIGSRDAICAVCGEDDPHCLERHHIAGSKFDDETVVVCRNCHRKLSDRQKDHPPAIGKRSDPLERIVHFLLGFADLLELIIGKLREFAHELIDRMGKGQPVAKRGRT